MKSINEVMGSLRTGVITPTNTRRWNNVTVGRCDSLRGWQQDLVRQFRSGNDVYGIVAPGGGKTMPVICYWVNDILGINIIQNTSRNIINESIMSLLFNPQRLRKIAFLVPTRTLAQQTVQDIHEHFANIISQLLNNIFENLPNVMERERRFPFMQTFWNDWIRRYHPQFNQFRNLYDQFMHEYNNTDPNRRNNIVQNFTTTIVPIIEVSISNFISSNLIYIQTGGQSTRGNPADFPVIITIYQSARSGQLRNAIRRSHLLVCDEAHLTQPITSSTEDPAGAQDKAYALYDVLQTLAGQSQLIYLSGTQNPQSARQFAEYLNDNFRRRFQLNSIATTGSRNMATISTVAFDQLNTDIGIIKSIVQSVRGQDWGNLYVLFSTNKIGNFIKEAIKNLGVRNLDNIMRNTQYGTEFQSSFDGLRRPENRMRVNPDNISAPQLQDAMGNNITSEARNIRNPLLRLAVSHGIGFISRKVPQETRYDPELMMDEADKAIVVKLFKDKKIKVMLATDAVGIGINIDVKNLYIPSLEKFSSMTKQNEEIVLRDLSQILNRAGRSGTPFATVYTPKDNIQRVMLALNSDPDNFEQSGITPKMNFSLRYRQNSTFNIPMR